MEHNHYKTSYPCRIEDFISLSKQGESISADVHLRIEKILRVDEHSKENPRHNDAYIFIGDFLFYLRDKLYTVSKVYSLSYLTNDSNDLHVDRQIANARLKMDYDRLLEGGIHVQEMYFSEKSVQEKGNLDRGWMTEA
jgi:hypothetical protein